MLAAAGCDDERNSANQAPIGPDVRGEWSGFYQFPGGPRVPVSATVDQNGSDLFVMTTLPDMGRLLTGTMNEWGWLFLTDANDGDTWTASEPVTPNSMYLIDYAFGPGTALRRMTLTR
jgi:hypothetical protein